MIRSFLQGAVTNQSLKALETILSLMTTCIAGVFLFRYAQHAEAKIKKYPMSFEDFFILQQY